MQVREYAVFVLGDQPWRIPTFEQLSSFAKHKEQSLGPSLETFYLDLESKGLASPWNKRAIEVFANGFMACPEHDPADKLLIKNAFNTYLKTLRKKHIAFISAARAMESECVDLKSLQQKTFERRDGRKRGVC